MKANPLMDDIFGQPNSLRQVIEQQFGQGRELLMAAAAMMDSATQVIFAGMGSSLYACAPAVSLLNRRGIAAMAVEASELLYFPTAHVAAGTLVVLVSRSGETVEAIKLIDVLRESGVRLIGVTNDSASGLARRADVSLEVGSMADRLVALQTYTGTAAALLLLASVAVRDDESALRGQMMGLPAAMEGLIEECAAASEGWRPWLEQARAVYVMGRGASLGSVHEGALLFHESARTPAVGMSVAQFRHGPVEVVDGGFRAIVFATQPETRELDAQLAEDLNALGADARVIGTQASSARGEAGLCTWQSEFPEGPLAAVLEIVPVQFAAVRLAEWQGFPAGEFQFAPLVTVDEAGFRNAAR